MTLRRSSAEDNCENTSILKVLREELHENLCREVIYTKITGCGTRTMRGGLTSIEKVKESDAKFKKLIKVKEYDAKLKKLM